MSFCREFTTHVTVLWCGAAIFFVGFIVGVITHCEAPENMADQKHRHEMEKLDFQLKHFNKSSQ